MKLNFRQGIARYQTDVLATPTFLQKSAGAGNFVDLLVSPDPTVIVFAHRSANYVVEETRSVANAWGPFSGSTTVYLYWDINLVTGEISRGTTSLPPIYSGSAPSTPGSDQHWFDTNETVMRVWNGTKWVEKIRCFAAYLSSGTIIRPYALGTQAGIHQECEGGNLVLDAYNKPLRQSDGSFITSVTSLIIVNNSSKKVKFETEVLSGMASEPIPMFSLVQMRAGRKIVLARSGDYMSRIAGIVLEDLHTNEPGYITTDGLVRNSAWNFPSSMVNRPIFCGANGEVTTTPPTTGVVQTAGFVFDTDSIYMNIFAPIVLDDISVLPAPTPPTPIGSPVADFYAATTSGVAPLTVNFANASSGSPTSYEWDILNDGNIDFSTINATYTFATPGSYSVRLRAINSFGFDDEIKTGYINVTAPVASGTFTNLGISLGGPTQIMQNQVFQVSLAISNDGFLTATNVERIITIPDLKGEQILVTGLPVGSVTNHTSGKTVITLPPVALLPSGTSYPVMFSVRSPGRSGTLTIAASVDSIEADSTLGDNTTSISVQVKP